MAKKSTNVFSPLKPEWVQFGEDNNYQDSFWEIVDFYLLHSICEGQSWKGRGLNDYYGWKKNPWAPDDYLKEKLLNAIWNGEDAHIYMAKTREQYQSKLFGKDLDEDFYLNPQRQRMCFTQVSGNSGSSFMSLFHHIRNALAHGRFGMIPLSSEDFVLLLEDGDRTNDRFEVTARIVIKSSSLLKMIQIIKQGPDIGPIFTEEIIESIRRGNNKKSKIIKDIGINETIWKRESQKMKTEGTIRYENNKWILTLVG